ncbi:MAG: electron transport complex subunit RsxE [Anaerosomatales bacterium]|nr:electron transport complex subunit RsxE [Anaerosomatales bacterium]MDT8433563.1 electron transport complex subunit RsxE [Anaerosomatales bacterium]
MREWIAVFKRGISIDNPLTVLMIGLCATLAVSTKLEGALFMGLAVIFVLGMSSIIVSSIRSLVPEQVRIPVFIVIIASFVTVVDLTMKAFLPDIYTFLGVWIPLIVVNCMILGRAEAFSYHQPVRLAIADGLGMGLGFSIVIVVLAAIRELFGSGEIVFLGARLIALPEWYRPPGVLLLFPGAFLVFGFISALAKWYNTRTSGRVVQTDAHCTIEEGVR